MMFFINLSKAAGNRIISNYDSDYGCFGAHSILVEFQDTTGIAYASAVYNSESTEVYLVNVEVPGQPQAFKWINEEHKDAYYSECKNKGVDPNLAWDSVSFTMIDQEGQILEYVKDIGEGYYDNLPIVEDIVKSEPVIMPMPGTIGGAKLVFPESKESKEMKNYTVNLDIRFTLDVTADNMDEALAKAKTFQETMKHSWGDGDNVIWNDTMLVKESVEHRKEW